MLKYSEKLSVTKFKERYKPHCGCNNSSGYHHPNTPHPKPHKYHRFDCQDFRQLTSQNNKLHCTTNQKRSLKMAKAEKKGIFFLKNRSRNLFFFLIRSHKSGYANKQNFYHEKQYCIQRKRSCVMNFICHNNNFSCN